MRALCSYLEECPLTRGEILQKVKQIILKHAKPVRIWLYGSEAFGEASLTSDIDVAFESVSERRDSFRTHGFGDVYLDILVKRFEFSYEMSWKVLKRYLSFVGIEVQNPGSCFKEAYQQGLLQDEEIWLRMIEQRNLSAHE